MPSNRRRTAEDVDQLGANTEFRNRRWSLSFATRKEEHPEGARGVESFMGLCFRCFPMLPRQYNGHLCGIRRLPLDATTRTEIEGRS